MAEAAIFSIATAARKSIASEIAKPGGTYAFQMISLLCCAEGELRSLRDTIDDIQSVLLDAEKRQWHDPGVKSWLKGLKDVLYDVQDLFDGISTEDLRRQAMAGSDMMKEVRLFFSESNQLARCFIVANRIGQIRKKLDQIVYNDEFKFEPSRDEPTLSIVRRTTPTFEREEDIIGREDDRDWIIERLLGSSSSGESVSVVSIVGIGGLGKTTLADLVYKDEKVKDCFELKMWVCHGDPNTFDGDLMIKKILNSVKDEFQGDSEVKENLECIENKSEEELQRLLGKALDGKKYLLVLDDLWNDDRLGWMRLRPLLMGGSMGSKILITTRNSSVTFAVAWAIDANSVIYNLHGLSEDKSWDLFKKMAFGDGETSLDSELEKIGRDIVQKCANVPLAIKTIGGLLHDKEKTVWLNFKERELSKIDGIMDVLKLSYDHLPSHLKHCFAYCALFPKDYVFDKQTMIQLWMAQGFIESSEGNDDLEEIGDSYVSNLLRRSFLEVEATNDDTSEVNMFKMHDLMHDLALKVAGGECKMINPDEGYVNRRIHHASFASQSSSSLQKVSFLLEATNLRTFLSLKDWRTFQVNNSLNEDLEIISKLRRCRALGLGRGDFQIPPSLGSQLKHLRFLDVSNNPIQNLPDSITDLFHLQTLKLSGCSELKTLPKDLKKLVSLRHLLIDGCVSLSHMPSLGELPSLRRLTLEDLDAMEFIEEISDLEQSDIARPFFPSLEKLKLGRCCNLRGWWGRRQPVGPYQDHQLSDSRSPFPKLLSMEISSCPHLNLMPHFPRIEILDLSRVSMKWLQQETGASAFIPLSKLEELRFREVDLEHSTLETLLPSLRNLKTLQFGVCLKLTSLSRGMQFLSSLQSLYIQYCEELDVSSHDDEHGTQWRSLAKLRILTFRSLPKLVALPEGIQHITTLETLNVSGCENLMCLPEWIGNFSSLQNLDVGGCSSLKSLPHGISRLTSLKTLKITGCPALRERCQRENGADWEKIAHLPCSREGIIEEWW